MLLNLYSDYLNVGILSSCYGKHKIDILIYLNYSTTHNRN